LRVEDLRLEHDVDHDASHGVLPAWVLKSAVLRATPSLPGVSRSPSTAHGPRGADPTG
jgi:hypothetical protein